MVPDNSTGSRFAGRSASLGFTGFSATRGPRRGEPSGEQAIRVGTRSVAASAQRDVGCLIGRLSHEACGRGIGRAALPL
jgi:hypothetical protein